MNIDVAMLRKNVSKFELINGESRDPNAHPNLTVAKWKDPKTNVIHIRTVYNLIHNRG